MPWTRTQMFYSFPGPRTFHLLYWQHIRNSKSSCYKHITVSLLINTEIGINCKMFKLISLSLRVCIVKNTFHRKLSWEIFDPLNTFEYCRKDLLSHIKTDCMPWKYSHIYLSPPCPFFILSEHFYTMIPWFFGKCRPKKDMSLLDRIWAMLNP